jgi:two-component sensor histidine kinase
MPAELDIRRTQSLGMHLVSALAEQLGAELKMSRDQGTSFKFIFATSGASGGKSDLPLRPDLAAATS